MRFNDIVSRVQSKLDDSDGTYITPEYVLGFTNEAQDWIYGKLRLADSDFDEQIVMLPGVQAGIPNLDSYQSDQQPLATLVQPTMIRWKLQGAPVTNWCRADGPLEFVRDIQNGIPAIDSWAWLKYSIKLSNFSTALDIEVTGDFLFDPLTDPDSQIAISAAANRCLSCKIASEIGKARGNKNWVTTYEADATDAMDDLAIAMTRADQAKTSRVGRMSRRGANRGRLSNASGSLV